MSLVILVFMFTLRFMAMYIEDLMGKSIDGEIVLNLFMHASLRVVIMAFPLAILCAALINFGNMGEHYELAALKSCGVGLLQFIRPHIVFAFLLTGLSLWLAFEVVPNSNREIISMIYDVSRTKSSFAIRPGYFYTDIDKYVMRISERDEKSGMLYGMLIYDFTEDAESPTVIVADSAYAKLREDGAYLQMKLFSGSRHEELNDNSPTPNSSSLGRLYFDTLYVNFDLSAFAFSRSDNRFHHRSVYPFDQLVWAIDSMERRLAMSEAVMKAELKEYIVWDSLSDIPVPDTIKKLVGTEILKETPPEIRVNNIEMALLEARAARERVAQISLSYSKEKQQIREYKHEYHNRIAIPLACLVFMLLGTSFGAVIRKGGVGPPAVAALGFFALFYGLMSQGWKMAKYGWSEPWIGAFLPVLVFIPISLYISYQAATDSSLMDLSRWEMWWDKLIEKGRFYVNHKGTKGTKI